MQPFDWQLSHVQALIASPELERGELAVADCSDTGTGKMHMTCAVAAAKGWSLVIVCPKVIVAEWRHVASLWGARVTACSNYDQYRLGLLPHVGSFQKLPPAPMQKESHAFVWCYPDPQRTLLVFDEAHKLGGLESQTASLGIGARRQRLRTLLLSATLLQDPLHAYAIGYMMGMHSLINFKKWTTQMGVEPVCVRPERKDANGNVVRRAKFARKFNPIDDAHAQEIMENMRRAMGDKFFRIRKKDVPGFPACTISTRYVDTEEMPELECEFGMAARVAVEAAMIPGLCDTIDDQIAAGNSVVVFVNFIQSMNTLAEKYPHAGRVHGGQSDKDRAQSINSFQQGLTDLILVNGAAGGAGLSLHDLTGRPRVGLVIPGWDAVQFQQILGRIHRAGALSPAQYYILFASGVPVMRRIRGIIDTKLANIESLNDADLDPTGSINRLRPAEPCGEAPRERGEAHHADQCPGSVLGPAHGQDSHPDQPMSTALTVANSNSQPEHSARKHAKSSPSKLKTLGLCPSFENDDTREVHPVTLRGTAMHESMERSTVALPHGQHRGPHTYEGLDEVERDLVTMCQDFVEEDLVNAAEVLQEIHVTTHDPDVAGFLDLCLIMPPKSNGKKTAKIRDWKFGFNPVPSPEINPQAISYTVGIFMARPDVDEIDFAFCLPRLDLILQHTFYRSELESLQLGISAIANRVRLEAGKTFTPHLEVCIYCARLGTVRCPATWQKGLAIGGGFQDAENALALPDVYNPEHILTPEDMAKALNLAAVLEEWCVKTRGAGLALRRECGLEIPGYDYIEKNGVRSVTNVAGLYEIAKRYGIEQWEFLEAAKVSLPKVTEAVRAHAAEGTKKKDIEQAFLDEAVNADCITRGAPFFVLQRSKKKVTKTLSVSESAD